MLRDMSGALVSAGLGVLFWGGLVAEASWVGNPAEMRTLAGRQWSLVYDGGKTDVYERFGRGLAWYGGGVPDVIEPHSDELRTLHFHRLVVEKQWDYEEYGQGFLRISPFLNTMRLDGTPFDPHLCEIGGGVRLATPQWRQIRMGFQASWDWAYGKQRNEHTYLVKGIPFLTQDRMDIVRRNDEVNWTEAFAASGLSWTLPGSLFHLYGGVSYQRTKVFIELADNDTNWRNDRRGGAFCGLSFGRRGWNVAIEKRYVSENSLGVRIGLRWGDLPSDQSQSPKSEPLRPTLSPEMSSPQEPWRS